MSTGAFRRSGAICTRSWTVRHKHGVILLISAGRLARVGGGSTVHSPDIVHNVEFDLWRVPQVLTPQYNSNLSATNDIFNHSNTHFWQYMQPGYDSVDFISCTGTNFLVRSNAYQVHQRTCPPSWLERPACHALS